VRELYLKKQVILFQVGTVDCELRVIVDRLALSVGLRILGGVKLKLFILPTKSRSFDKDHLNQC